MLERKWVREDVLIADISCKVVGFPIRAIPRAVSFYHAVILRDTGFIEPGAPDAHTGSILEIACHVHLQARFQLPVCLGQIKDVVIKRRQRGSRQKPVHLHKRHRAVHLLLQRFVERRISVIKRVGIDILYLCPYLGDIPFVGAQINVEKRFGCVNRFRLKNLGSPGETINQFGKRATIGIKCLVRFNGVIEMRQSEIAREGPVKRRESPHMLFNSGKHCIRRNEVALRGRAYPIGCSHFNPTAHDIKFHIGERRLV